MFELTVVNTAIKETLTPIYTLGLAALLFGGAVVIAKQPAVGQQAQRILTVTGRGTEAISATLAQVSLGVEVQGRTAQEVQQEVARRANAVLAVLRTREVSQLQTTGLSLTPNYQYTNNQRILVGYIGRNTVSFRIASDRVGSLLDAAVQAGATTIENISFTAPEATIAAAQRTALQRATQEAQSQAQAVLSVLNLQPRQVMSIQISQTTPPPRPFAVRAATMAESTPVVSGELQVEASVTLQINY
ncbi:MAG: SIMPL domain-containing protein [Thermosynechococcus sp. Uc]|uniref:SIMPL domain-containing protein n=1 Tax=Thermosynechococcus sp. Uc TaxID=3034853 RepID=UPI00259FB1A5|nr:SIMPL domain-containing protein [Thermosynechococcus sp. Uc]MDM7327170.1 SIMPL domain-containing protein [Thermosynechococcus sp. Uc]